MDLKSLSPLSERSLIGVDFDNTIVFYDHLFHQLAVEKKLIEPALPPSKTSIRNYLRNVGAEHEWTKMQGEVYGKHMHRAEPFSGVLDFFQCCRKKSIPVVIVSHKTKFPFLGPRYDLHQSAKQWLKRHGLDIGSFGRQAAYFEETKQGKIARIQQLACTHFIDDLPELLMDGSFPRGVDRIHFARDEQSEEINDKNELKKCYSWKEIQESLFS